MTGISGTPEEATTVVGLRETHTKREHTILVADDEPALLRLMEFVLQRQGYELITATSGDEALTLIRERRPDLVVLDIMMPRMDGYEVAEALRADPELKGLPIVMLSAKAQDEDIARGLAVGVDTYIIKPFDPDRLVEAVAAYLSQDPARRPESVYRGS